jgi:glycerophosphoryl diester phosphodiesterase
MAETTHPNRGDGVEIRANDRVVRLKWHRMKRRAADTPFTPAILAEALAAGASSEIDLRLHADGGFAVLHDETLDRETTGHGLVREARADEIRTLRMRTPDGMPTEQPVLLLDDLVEGAGKDAAPGALIQLDLKESAAAIDDAVAADFGALVAPVGARFILSGGDFEAVSRLAAATPGLATGYDPCHGGVIDRLAERSAFEIFVEEALAHAPAVDTIYLDYALILKAATIGYNIVQAFHDAGKRIDAYTLNTSQPHAAGTLRTLVGLGVDQITTDEPIALQALYEKSDTSQG